MSSKMQVTENSKTFLFSFDADELVAEKSVRLLDMGGAPGKSIGIVVFTQWNAKPLDDMSCSSEALFLAEAYLQAQGNEQIEIKIGDQALPFPAQECLKTLPEIQQDVQLISELDRYDGPISGFFESAGQLFHFDWCMHAFDKESEKELFRGPRFFYARLIPASESATIKKWLKDYQDSADADGTLWESRPRWGRYPITHVWSEAFDQKQDFAAIRIVYKNEGEE